MDESTIQASCEERGRYCILTGIYISAFRSISEMDRKDMDAFLLTYEFTELSKVSKDPQFIIIATIIRDALYRESLIGVHSSEINRQ